MSLTLNFRLHVDGGRSVAEPFLARIDEALDLFGPATIIKETATMWNCVYPPSVLTTTIFATTVNMVSSCIVPAENLHVELRYELPVVVWAPA